jgi:hypothetical protein
MNKLLSDNLWNVFKQLGKYASSKQNDCKKLVCQVGLASKIGPASARPIAKADANALLALWGE